MSSVNIEILVGGRRVGTLEVGSTGGWNNYRDYQQILVTLQGE